MSRCLLVILLLAVCTIIRGGKAQTLREESYIARAGEVFISEKEFLERFELLPGFGRRTGNDLQNAKLELLYSMIAEKLLAQEALERGLTRDSVFIRASDHMRKLYARDELYREEISSKVTVSRDEIDTAVNKAARSLGITFLYCENLNDADFLRSRIITAADFDRLSIDSTLKVTRDTITVDWGEADPALEHAAFNLSKGEVSDVITAGGGYYIFRVDSVKRNGSNEAQQAAVLRERVESTLRLRKEEDRLDVFLRETLRDSLGYAPTGTFRRFANILADLYSRAPGGTPTGLTPDMLIELRKRCEPILRDTFLVAGSTVLTVDDVVARFPSTGFAASPGDREQITRRLRLITGVWIQQEVLAQEAIRRGLDRRPAVQHELGKWEQHYLAELLKQIARNRIAVTEAELFAVLEHQGTITVPSVRIRELHLPSAEEAEAVLKKLGEGTSLERIIEERSNGQPEDSRNGLSDRFRITERYPIGSIAWDMEIGDRFGPLQDSNGYFIFELVEKDTSVDLQDSSAEGRRTDAMAIVRAGKEKIFLNEFIAQLAGRRGYVIYGERLSALSVRSTPMMTFRILGFGGRIFAVPFVERQVEWVNTIPPETPVLP